jgi:hypothetical protein
MEFASARRRAHCVFDSTFSNPAHPRLRIDQALAADKRIGILHINRRWTTHC